MKDYLYSRLEKLYPDKNIVDLSSKYLQLYQQVYNAASSENMEMKEYLNSMDFNYSPIKSEFDLNSSIKLINQFGITQAEIADWTGVTRADISRKINQGVNYSNWANSKLREYEIDMVENTINNQKM